MKHKILSLLVLLVTAASGAWAAPMFGVTEITPDMVPASWANDNSGFTRNFLPGLLDNLTVNYANPWSGMPSGDVFLIYKYTQSTGRYNYVKFSNGRETGGGVMGTKRELYLYVNNYKVYYATAYVEPDPNIIPVTPVAGQENQWEFDMPGSDVVLTPVYSVATVLGDDDTETSFASLKEAFANVQDGDIITLDWNVTLTEDLKTPVTNSGVKFTLDFNGYTIDGGVDHNGFTLVNSGDEMTLTDNTYDQKGGFKGLPGGDGKYIFAGGRYNIPSYSSAANLNQDCSDPVTGLALAEGMEFVDLEGEAEANDGFTMRVTYAAFELTIGPKKFATFYADQNVKLDEDTPNGVGLYTIATEGIDLVNNKVTVSKVNDPIALAGMPLLVYNGTNDQQLVKLKVTSDEPTSGQMWSMHFQGTAVDREFTTDDMDAYNYFALSGGKAFAPVRGTGTLAAHKCWLQFAKENQQQAPGARSIMLVFEGEATGIDSMVNDQRSMDDYYDLNGRKIQKPTRKGVYIKNGQKVVK